MANYLIVLVEKWIVLEQIRKYSRETFWLSDG